MEPTPCRLTSLGTSLDTPQMRTSVRFGPAAEGFGEAWGVGCWSRCLGGILSPLTAVMNDGRDPSRPQPAPSHTSALCGPHRGSGFLSMGTRGALCFCVPAFRMEDDHASCWGRSRRWSGWGAAWKQPQGGLPPRQINKKQRRRGLRPLCGLCRRSQITGPEYPICHWRCDCPWAAWPPFGARESPLLGGRGRYL